MMNSEQVILERGFAAWNTRATTIPSPPTAEQAEMTRRAAEKVYEYFWELRQHAVTIDRIQAIIASELMAVAAILPGFPTTEGIHYGTQSLGMITAALCENASPDEIAEWIATQNDDGLSRSDLVQGIACALEHTERRAFAIRYLPAAPSTPSSSAEIAQRIAEKICVKLFVEVFHSMGVGGLSEDTQDEIAAIITAELAATPITTPSTRERDANAEELALKIVDHLAGRCIDPEVALGEVPEIAKIVSQSFSTREVWEKAIAKLSAVPIKERNGVQYLNRDQAIAALTSEMDNLSG